MLKGIRYTAQFKRDYKLAIKRGCREDALTEVLNLLMAGTPLPPQYRDHPLVNSKRYGGARDCHIAPDWILIYRIQNDELILELLRTGSHSDLF